MFENIKDTNERKVVELVLEAIVETANMLIGEKPNYEEKKYESSALSNDTYSIIMGITGQFEGNIMFSFDDKFIKNVASMMNGMEITTVDELAESSVIEFVNMVSGAATIKIVDFYDSEKISMAPPVFVKGHDVSVTGKIKDVYGYSFKMNIGVLDLGIAVKVML